MIGLIERCGQQIRRYRPTSTFMLVIGLMTVSSDPTRRPTGYGGVLPVPRGTVDGAPLRIDPLLQQRRDLRAERGRVLYAPGHEPAAMSAKVLHKGPCPQRGIVQLRAINSSPTA